MHEVDLPVADLHAVVRLALARGGRLLTAGELLLARRIEGLQGAEARLYARLTARQPTVFAVDRLEVPGVPDVPAAVHRLVELDLLDTAVAWHARLEACTLAELKPLLKARGLPVSGGRAAVLKRLRDPGEWSRAFVRIRHPRLLRRLEQWALLSRHADRSRFVVERLGHVRWPAYALTPGSLHPDRRHLLHWEAVFVARDEATPEALVEVLRTRRRWPPGGLDLRRSLRRRVLAAARERERAGDPEGARALYLGLVGLAEVGVASVAVRVARTHEAQARPDDALAYLEGARAGARPDLALSISRTGRRLASTLRRGWAPDPPLATPPDRHLTFPEGGKDRARPLWVVGGRALAVEEAVAARVEAAGRRVLRGEGPLWTTLFALLFAETYFLPVPGALPVPFLTGPLDLGTPMFAARRPEVAQVLAAVDAGHAPQRIRAADKRWRGVALAGAAWERASGEELALLAEGLGPRGLRCVLDRLCSEGWRCARGLPDLVVLPGQPVRLPEAFPSRLGPTLLAVEVKGPGDAVRDEQAVWFDRLLTATVPTELWHIGGLRGRRSAGP